MDAERTQIGSIIEDNYRIIANYKNKWLLAEAVDKKKSMFAPYIVFDVANYRYQSYLAHEVAELAFAVAAFGIGNGIKVEDHLGCGGKTQLKIGQDGKVLLNGQYLPFVRSVGIKNINPSSLAEVVLCLDLHEIDIRYDATDR